MGQLPPVPAFPHPQPCDPLPASTGTALPVQPSQRGRAMNRFVPLPREHWCQCKEGSRSAAEGSGAGQDRPKSGAWQRGRGGGHPWNPHPSPAPARPATPGCGAVPGREVSIPKDGDPQPLWAACARVQSRSKIVFLTFKCNFLDFSLSPLPIIPSLDTTKQEASSRRMTSRYKRAAPA